MDGELNNFNINNTNITFSVTTNNIELSDEIKADPIYQRQMGTNYSRGKKVGKTITIVGLSIAFTATAIASGGIIRNIFVPNPPTVSNVDYYIEGENLYYSISLQNKLSYVTYYQLMTLYGETLTEGDCSEAKDYVVTYSPVHSGAKLKFVVTFTNSFDYRKAVHTNTFTI